MDCLQKLARVLANNVEAPLFESFRVHKLRPYGHGHRPGAQELRRRLQVYAAGGDEINLRQRSFQRLDVVWSSNVPAGENLYKGRTRLPGFNDLGWSQRSRDAGFRVAAGDLDDAQV